MEKDDLYFINHLKDLKKRSDERGIIIYTEFLGLSEQNLLYSHASDIGINEPVLFGGFDFSERKLCVFDGSQGYMDVKYPIVVLRITPLSGKFTESLTHRDFLGSLMGLGIKRETLGDIYLNESTAYLICLDSISDFIKENLISVKHTRVNVTESDFNIDYQPEITEIQKSVSSLRIDAIISAAVNTSRGTAQELIASKKVFINGREIMKDSREVNEGDIITVRGTGRFRFKSVDNVSRKGRTIITIVKYN